MLSMCAFLFADIWLQHSQYPFWIWGSWNSRTTHSLGYLDRSPTAWSHLWATSKTGSTWLGPVTGNGQVFLVFKKV